MKSMWFLCSYITYWKPIKQVMYEHKNHMDFMPVPAGSWAEYNAGVQAKYHKQIAAAAVFTLITYTFLWSQGALEILHGAPKTNPPPAEWFNEDGTWKTD